MNISESESIITNPFNRNETVVENITEDLISGNAISLTTSMSSEVSTEYTNFRIFLLIVMGLIAVTTIVVNGLVLYIFWKSKKRLRSPTHLLLANLAVADLLVGIFVMPLLMSFSASPIYYWRWGDSLCFYADYVHFSLCAVSMLSMIAIAVERFIGVTFPLQYKRMLSTSRVKIIIGMTWITAVAITATPLTIWPSQMKPIPNVCFVNLRKELVLYVSLVVYSIPLLTTVILYLLIFINAVRPLNYIPRDKKNSENCSTIASHKVSKGLIQSKAEKDKFDKAKAKHVGLSKRILFLVCAMIGMFGPVFLLFFLAGLKSSWFTIDRLLISGWLRYGNSTLNPFIYALSVPGYKKEFYRIFFNEDKEDEETESYSETFMPPNFKSDTDSVEEEHGEVNPSINPQKHINVQNLPLSEHGSSIKTLFLPQFCIYCGQKLLIPNEDIDPSKGGTQPCYCVQCFERFSTGQFTFAHQKTLPSGLSRPPSATDNEWKRDIPDLHYNGCSLSEVESDTPPRNDLNNKTNEKETFVRNPRRNLLEISALGDAENRKSQVEQIKKLRQSIMVPIIEQKNSMLNSNANPNDIDWDFIKQLDQLIEKINTDFSV